MRWGYGQSSMPEGTKILLIANGIGFFLQLLTGSVLTRFFGLVPRLAWSHLHIWQFVTYMFLHGGMMHILVNMYMLWLFGSEIERMWGQRAFLKYYFIAGIGAALFYTLVNPFSSIPMIGASGALYGVLTAYAVTFPDRELMLLFPPIRMKARTLVIVYVCYDLMMGVFGSTDGVAHFAHLGGALVGFLYLKQNWHSISIRETLIEWRRKRRMRVVREKEEEMAKLRRLVDQILDKANDVGMDRLSREEKQFLKKASKILNRNKS